MVGSTNNTCIVIGGYTFRGYYEYDTQRSKTYVTEPSRSNTGAMININNIPTFDVITIYITYKYLEYEDKTINIDGRDYTVYGYKTLAKLMSSGNEFVVKYFDIEEGAIIRGKFYFAPATKKAVDFYKRNPRGIKDFTIELISTNNLVLL